MSEAGESSLEATTVAAAAEEATTTLSIDDKFAILNANVDAFFLIVMGCIVFLMQCGFAFLEAGSVRSKNTVNILIKNMLDAFIGGVSYWAIGWALAYGENGNPFCGGSFFFSYQMPLSMFPSWFFQFVFAATAATIVSGAVAERCQFFAYFMYSIIITGWVYPVVTHWAWDGAGWLNMLGYHDFAGSGVVHLLGATCALFGCLLIKPRMGRFTKDGKPIEMQGHSVPFAALGGFILLFGFLAFNGGSQLAISGQNEDGVKDTDVVGLAIVNTIIGGCGGGLVVLFTNKMQKDGKWSYLLTLNGALTGMVAQCAGCDVFMPWAALIVGIIGGLAFTLVHNVMLKCRLDDPLDAVAVHGGGGVVGVLMEPFFAFGEGIFWVGGTAEPWKQLGVNLAGILAIFAWSAFWSILIFGSLSYFKLLRIDRDCEFRGCDMVKHGEPAYPANAWVELQYDQKKKSTNAPMMKGTQQSGKEGGAHFNDAFQMVPTTGGLFRQLSKNFDGFQGNPDVESAPDNNAAAKELE